MSTLELPVQLGHGNKTDELQVQKLSRQLAPRSIREQEGLDFSSPRDSCRPSCTSTLSSAGIT